MAIRVLLTGAAGKMGREAIKAISRSGDIELVGAVVRGLPLDDAGTLAGIGPIGVPVTAVGHDQAALTALIEKTRPQVLLDFTNAETAMAMARVAHAHGLRFVTGSTGFSQHDLAELKRLAEATRLGTLVAPNFAIGALLMIQFARKAAEYFDHAEIVELHHNQKLDAPSGTAVKTAEAMRESQARFGATNVPETEKIPHVRGGELGGIHIHSVRLPGMLAHQEVLFGGLGQVLTIRHDALSRECYMPGVLLGIRKVMTTQEYVHGLEHLL